MKQSIDRDLAADPILMPHRGRLAWMFPSGKIVPDVSGGIDDPNADPEKKFTQADLDRLIEDRLKRERSPEPPADYKDLQAKATELDSLKAATVTAEQKTAARIAALEKSIEDSNTQSAADKTARVEADRRSAIVAEAALQKAANPQQVAALLKKDAVTIGDDGQVTGAAEAVKEFLADPANAHHVGKAGIPKPDVGQGKTGESKTFGDGGRAEAAKRFGGTPVAAAATTPQK